MRVGYTIVVYVLKNGGHIKQTTPSHWRLYDSLKREIGRFGASTFNAVAKRYCFDSKTFLDQQNSGVTR